MNDILLINLKHKILLSNALFSHVLIFNSITLAVCCGYVLHPIGRKTINIPEIILGVHAFMVLTVKTYGNYYSCYKPNSTMQDRQLIITDSADISLE